jgi:xanthine dehydrogenase molybdopterin-binding subunit B
VCLGPNVVSVYILVFSLILELFLFVFFFFFHSISSLHTHHLILSFALFSFPGPQGTLIAEQWIEHVAHALQMPPEKVRRMNLYRPGDTTHFKMPVNTR